MAPAAKKLKKPGKTASFKEYIEYYLNKKGWSQSQLAEAARLNQPYVNKLINGKVRDVSVETMMCICLALQLTVPETKDLLSRVQRAFSPALELHDFYQKLLAIYVFKDFTEMEERNVLVCADDYLAKHGLPPLPQKQ